MRLLAFKNPNLIPRNDVLNTKKKINISINNITRGLKERFNKLDRAKIKTLEKCYFKILG